jgi:hypothetical protein
MPVINSTRGVFGSQSSILAIGGEQVLEVYLFGGAGGSGSSNRANSAYRTANYYRIKEGGAGGVLYSSFKIKKGTSIGFSVGGGGRGGGQQGNPSDASGGYNGGGTGSYGQYDLSGGGGGYTCIFASSIGKNQNGIIALAPGGGGGAGGPGYPGNATDRGNGGGGIVDSNGKGNDGETQMQYPITVARGGGLTSGGAGGDANVADGDGQSGSALTGANTYPYRNAWGNGGAGGGGWFGGGSGANDGTAWTGGGGGAGSAFVRGSGLSYNSAGLAPISGVTYTTHSFYTQTYGTYGDGSNPAYTSRDGQSTGTVTYNSMRMPVQTTLSVYPGNNVSYGGIFNNGGANAFVGFDGGHGAIIYRINGGAWTTVSYTGSDTTLSL